MAVHDHATGKAARQRAAELLDRVSLPDPAQVLRQLSRTSCPAACASG